MSCEQAAASEPAHSRGKTTGTMSSFLLREVRADAAWAQEKEEKARKTAQSLVDEIVEGTGTLPRP